MTEPKAEIIEDIQQMLFGLGDCPKPLLSTAEAIEDTLVVQTKSLLDQAKRVSIHRGATHIDYQDILFLLRKDKWKLQRLINYFTFKDEKNRLKSGMLDVDEEKQIITCLNKKNNNAGECINFLKSIGVEISKDKAKQEADPIRHERNERASYISESLSVELYDEYLRSRRIAFQGNKVRSQRFINWLKTKCDEDNYVSDINSTLAMDIILFLAKELIAEIVDMVFLIRRDTLSIPGDPTSSVEVLNRHSILRKETFGADGKVESIAPITPDEVDEVLRRFFSPLLFPFNLFAHVTYKDSIMPIIT